MLASGERQQQGVSYLRIRDMVCKEVLDFILFWWIVIFFREYFGFLLLGVCVFIQFVVG